MLNATATDQETGLAALIAQLPAPPADYDINDNGDAGMSWEFPGGNFVQLELPGHSDTATWLAWQWQELRQDTPERYLNLKDPATWQELIATMEKLAC